MNRFEEISEDAFKNDVPSDSYSLLEIHLFLVLKDIYEDYANGRISKEQGTKLKNLASVQFDKYYKQSELDREINENRVESIRKTESLRAKFRKELKNQDKNALNTAIKLIELYSMEYWEGVNTDDFEGLSS